MAEKKYMQKFDMATDFKSLSPSQQYYVKKIDRLNTSRFVKHKDQLGRARRFGFFLTSFVIGTYVYTMYAMKQEKFLDDDFNTLPDNVQNK